MIEELSRGYEAAAHRYIAARSASGRSTVRNWVASLPKGCSIVDVGSGHGEPLTSVLVEAGLSIWAIDASPTLVAAFQQRFPNVEIACEPAECSSFFDRTFDAALMIGLIFLLPEDRQRVLMQRLLGALGPQARLLFSAPRQAAKWNDILTGEASLSLGAHEYERMLEASGFRVVAEHADEGENHYFEAQRVLLPTSTQKI